MSLAPGTQVWAPDPDQNGFVEAKVVSQSGDKIKVEYPADARFKPTTLDAKTKAPITDFPKDEIFERLPHERTPLSQMDGMSLLNKAEVLDNVHVLFQQSQSSKPGDGPSTIYSSVGPVLISMNPFKELPVFGGEWITAYQKCNGDQVKLHQLGPHAYRTGDDAYHGLCRMVTNKMPVCNQSVVICGESGAGKTYTNRHMLKYLCEISKSPSGGADPDSITCANELLEAFGNATTTRNDNSSRFGKLTELYFKPGGSGLIVCSCEVKHYLIERSRIMGAPPEERNYHIFYELVRGGDNATYNLTTNAQDYNAIKDGAGIKEPGVYEKDDKSDFAGLNDRMKKSGFSAEKTKRVFSCIAAVLHMGNIAVGGDNDKSNCDGNQAGMKNACQFLGVDASALAKAVCENYISVPGGGKMRKDISKVKAQAQVDAVAKMIYSRTFDAIVEQITEFLRKEKTSNTIGLLDIFGFEDMRINGFEQMFINLTNERIQHLFNEIMFEREKKVYSDDGIDSSFLKGPNNIECVKTFLAKRPAGIVPLLGEQVSLGIEDEKADGANLVSKLNSRFTAKHAYYKVATPQEINKVCKKKGIVSADKHSAALDYQECFSIVHYAGLVTYTVKDFIPKSRDHLGEHVTEIFKNSKEADVQEMFHDDKEASAKSETVGSKFGKQLEELAEVLSSGETLFVRCIKSNPGKKPAPVLDRQSVLEQLNRGGVIAALEIRAAGLPDQMKYEDFINEFNLLEIGDQKSLDAKARTEKIVRNIIGAEAIAQDMIKMGKTKIFMKSGNVSFLRAASRFKEHLYARRVQRLLGSSRVRKLDNLYAILAENEKLAEEHGLLKYKAVTDAIKFSKDKIGPIYEKLQAAKKEHGATNWDQLQKVLDPYMDQVKELLQSVDSVKEAVNKLEKRRRALHNAFDQRVSGAIQSVADLESRVDRVEADSAEMDDVPDVKADVDKCKASCKGARAKLEELRTKVLPDLQKTGFDSVDLEAAEKQGDPCPQVTTLLAAAEELVKSAETLGFEVLRVKREFMKLIEELGESREHGQKTLEGLQANGARCAAEGMTDVTKEIDAAAKLDFQLGTILDKAKDPEAFKKVHAQFLEQVSKAEAAVSAGLIELERRERERAERNELDSSLDNARSKINDCLHLIEMAVVKLDTYEQDRQQLNEIKSGITKLQQDAVKLTIEELREKAKAIADQGDKAAVEIATRSEAAQKERKDDFKKKLSMWQNMNKN